MPKPVCPHCGTLVTEHPATPCLSAWIAEAVMGWEVCHDSECSGCDKGYLADGPPGVKFFTRGFNSQWHPHEDIAAAWEVVERAMNYYLQQVTVEGEEHGCTAQLTSHDMNSHAAHAETMPLAICRAALLSTSKEPMQ